MGDGKIKGQGRRRACPICAKPATPAHRPFCSAHCAEVDLGRWLAERYRIPAVEPPDDFSEAPPEGAEEAPGEGADEGPPGDAKRRKGAGET